MQISYVNLVILTSQQIILIIIVILYIDCCSQLMSQISQSKVKTTKAKRQKKIKSQEENEVTVTRPIDGIKYPSYMHKLNYFSMQTFQTSVEDQVTTNVFHEAIMNNQHLFSGKIVLHITEGINLLYSIFAARAGSKKVYCVIAGQTQRQKQNVFMIRKIIQQNELENHIQAMLLKDFTEKVDIIIGEPMGYCLHFDGLVDKIIKARDLFLKQNGIMFPNFMTFKCALLNDQYFSQCKVNYWNDIYGVPMTSIQKWVYHEPVIRVVDSNLLVSKVAKAITFNLQTVTYEQIIKIDKVIQVDLFGSCKANGIAFWFEAYFDYGVQKKQIKASPWLSTTKYTQVTLYWPKAMQFNGGKLRVRVKGQKNINKKYSVITTQVDSSIYQYSLS